MYSDDLTLNRLDSTGTTPELLEVKKHTSNVGTKTYKFDGNGITNWNQCVFNINK